MTSANTARSCPGPAGWNTTPKQIWARTQEVVSQALDNAGLTAADLVAVGLTNQRETTVVWNPRTGKPYGNAIVWQDTRTDKIAAELERQGHGDLIRERSGLPPSTYFAGGKLAWMLAEVDGLRAAADSGEALFGTIDSWLLWNLTGGVDGGRHLTDVTNASRTMLMNLTTLDWDEELLDLLGVPRSMLPRIVPSAHPEHYGRTRSDGPFGGEVVIGGALGDQHAAMVGQVCLAKGDAKNTYGTGNFLLLNTGPEICRSTNGLLTTVCYQFGDDPCMYALEGSIAVTGSSVQWLRDQLGIIAKASEIEALASQVPDTGGAYFVPAFSGLFAPYWRSDARGVIVGLSRFHTKAHLARAALEAICYQSRDVVRGHGGRRRRTPGRAQGRRRGHRERAVHADPGRHARHRCQPAGGPRDHGPGRGVRGGAGHGFLGVPGGAARPLAGRPALDPADHGRATGRGVRGLAEGHTTHARLGGGLIR